MTRQSSVDITPDGFLVTQGGGDSETWSPTEQPGHFQAIDSPQTADFAVRDGKAVAFHPHGENDSLARVGPLYQRSVPLLIVLLASAAAVTTLIRPAIRLRRALPATRLQRRLNGAQLIASAAWLIALGAGAVFASGAENEGRLVFDSPGSSILIASSAALFASLLSAGVLIVCHLPGGAPRVGGSGASCG